MLLGSHRKVRATEGREVRATEGGEPDTIVSLVQEIEARLII